jgi:MFS family permease
MSMYHVAKAHSYDTAATVTDTPDENSWHYRGWRVVLACFVMAVFSWGFGFYGQSVYLAELQRLNHWPTSIVSTASTVYYLLSAVLVIFVSDAMARIGPRRFLLAGMVCLALATAIIGQVATPWQLYAGYLLMSFGWAAMGVAAITTIIGLWFDARRGLAISLALNGASVGGILGTPALVLAVQWLGFAGALTLGAIVMAVVLAPMIVVWAGRPRTPRPADQARTSPHAGAALPAWTRRRALGDFAFWTITAPFALALTAQVGFIVHQIALLEPSMGRLLAGTAVAITAVAAVVGRVGLGFVIDRLNQRLASAISFLSQTAALAVIALTSDPTILLVSCAVFGLSVGNVITLPSLIIQREFDAGAFAMLVGLSTAIGQFTYAFGPGLFGLLRDLSGSYAVPVFICAAFDLIAAAIVLLRRA